MFLVRERRLGPASEYAPYIAVLPGIVCVMTRAWDHKVFIEQVTRRRSGSLEVENLQGIEDQGLLGVELMLARAHVANADLAPFALYPILAQQRRTTRPLTFRRRKWLRCAQASAVCRSFDHRCCCPSS